jgi:hypothetical protein
MENFEIIYLNSKNNNCILKEMELKHTFLDIKYKEAFEHFLNYINDIPTYSELKIFLNKIEGC